MLSKCIYKTYDSPMLSRTKNVAVRFVFSLAVLVNISEIKVSEIITMNIDKLMNKTFTMELQCDEINRLSSNSSKKQKRFRSAFTTDQINGLEKEYKKFPYIGILNRKAIAKSLNISERAIKIWFQNRRMKEKRDKTQNNYDEMQNNANGVILVNDHSMNSTARQSDNDPVPNNISPQMQRTGLKKPCIDNFPNNYVRPVISVTSTGTTDKKNHTENDNVKSPYFQNNTVTSSTIDSNTAEFSIKLLKKYKNYIPGRPERPIKQRVIQKSFPMRRHDVAQSCKPKKDSKSLSETTHRSAPTTIHQRHSVPQVPGGYVPSLGQNANCYQQSCLPVGNILWKPIDSNMPNVLPLNQFALIPNPPPQTANVPEKKCFCNCHGHRNSGQYFQENQIPQYIYAVPFQNAPAPFTYPI